MRTPLVLQISNLLMEHMPDDFWMIFRSHKQKLDEVTIQAVHLPSDPVDTSQFIATIGKAAIRMSEDFQEKLNLSGEKEDDEVTAFVFGGNTGEEIADKDQVLAYACSELLEAFEKLTGIRAALVLATGEHKANIMTPNLGKEWFLAAAHAFQGLSENFDEVKAAADEALGEGETKH